MNEGHISIRKEVYNLMLSSNKREFIYEDLIFIDTKPITYQDK